MGSAMTVTALLLNKSGRRCRPATQGPKWLHGAGNCFSILPTGAVQEEPGSACAPSSFEACRCLGPS